ncbi:bifunctional heptose 7-phosphate kinase/heptose 1-phosphate adenyltransferase [Nibrella saemangeumensis]|uniref:bifunctional heptose 7-phosphate kinase/heptose 1-phosphate adenyltransferase n=1 Tax=Nibrella saemangeumensis TaxID=1084526 RepID=UPI0031E91EF7
MQVLTDIPQSARMAPSELTAIFSSLSSLRVGVIGDFAVDLYFAIDKNSGEYSIETGKAVHWGSRPQASLGGAGNVVANLAALGISGISVFGCTGNDLYGREMRHLFQQVGADTHSLLAPAQGWDTCTYIKPMAGPTEENRIDFGTRNTLPDEGFTTLLQNLRNQLPYLDVLIINQQFLSPLVTAERVGKLNTLMALYPNCRFVADLRHHGNAIRGAILKVNTKELAVLRGIDHPDTPSLDWCSEHGRALNEHIQGPVLITRGEQGIAYVDGPDVQVIDGLALTGELDTVGAGDTVVATFSACIGAGVSPAQAIEIANLAAAVTVQKLHQTGTASPDEILALTRLPLAQ